MKLASAVAVVSAATMLAASGSGASTLTFDKLQGAPSKSLLSILGVLRRPATSADSPPETVVDNLLSGPFGQQSVYVNYMRRARVINGASYYLIPVRGDACGGCGPRDRIWEQAWHALGQGRSGGPGGGSWTAAQIEHGEAVTAGSGVSSAVTITMVVPDSVAIVTLHLPAVVDGSNRHPARALTYSTKPVGNLVVMPVTGKATRLHNAVMTWRNEAHEVIKTITRL
jgi:hypothetical protein